MYEFFAAHGYVALWISGLALISLCAYIWRDDTDLEGPDCDMAARNYDQPEEDDDDTADGKGSMS